VFLFGSDVRGDGHILHTQYDTQTINLKATYAPTDADRIVFKGLHNELYANLPARAAAMRPGQCRYAAHAAAVQGSLALCIVEWNSASDPICIF
jgi:hypothetical protein